MFFKVLAFIWLVYGAPLSHLATQWWSSQVNQPRLIKEAILTAGNDRQLVSQLQAKALSRKITRISKCFELDPLLYTSLIWRESHFKQSSKSRTGAVGMTQLTTPGIHEVLDRLGEKSMRKKDHLRQQLAVCYPSLLKQIPSQVDPQQLPLWKKKVASSPELALIFGAVLFRSYHTGDDRQALEKYNGDPKVKVGFAQDVLALKFWIGSSFKVIPEIPEGSSRFLASIQDL
jgi:hypothetical protein